MTPRPTMSRLLNVPPQDANYSVYNFEIRRDVTSGRLRTSLRVTIKRTCFATIPYTTRAFHGTSPEIRNLLEVTSRLISKLYRLYSVCRIHVELVSISYNVRATTTKFMVTCASMFT